MKKIVRLTESDLLRLVKRVIKEQIQNTQNFQIDFSNFPGKLGEIVFNDENLGVYMNLTANRFLGPQKITSKVPATKSSNIIIPKFETPIIAGQSFKPNLVTISNEVKTSLKNNAKNLVNTIQKIYEVDSKNGVKNVVNFLGNGFNLVGHADGDVPRATIANKEVVRDHGGKLYGGATTPNKKNEWLARKRATNAYSVFYNELKNLLYRSFQETDIIDAVLKILKLNGSNTKLTIINHLNPDGTQNSSAIDPQFRRFEFNPTFKINIPIPYEIIIPGYDVTKPIEGTKRGMIKLPLEVGNEGIVPAFQTEGSIANDLWWGVTYEDIKNFNIPIIKDGQFNNKSVLNCEISNKSVIVDGFNFGRLSPIGGDNINRFVTAGYLCLNADEIRTLKWGDKTYYQVKYVQVNLKRK